MVVGPQGGSDGGPDAGGEPFSMDERQGENGTEKNCFENTAKEAKEKVRKKPSNWPEKKRGSAHNLAGLEIFVKTSKFRVIVLGQFDTDTY